ncbi:FitA-like ribbon-helix-helix domain-containing protein [Lyngbya confervoides]|uniref:FitA-like ribbon-helix-helix domain-containing protein n=1 Tax=Lyngbya confervoides TaxID=207921 RepID=UPI0035C92D67
MPEDLYQHLKRQAQKNRRSLNSEILICLEQTLQNRPRNAQATLDRMRALRQKTAKHPLTDEVLEQAKHSGRP